MSAEHKAAMCSFYLYFFVHFTEKWIHFRKCEKFISFLI